MSQKKIIAIDCDDVLVNTTPYVIAYYNQAYGTGLTMQDMYSDNLDAWGVTEDQEAINRVEEYLKTDEFQTIPPFQETVEAIQKLSTRHELHVITGRTAFLTEATKRLLDQYFPGVFVSIEFTGMFAGHARSKGDVCLQIGAELLIDDHLRHAEQVAEKGIDVLLFGDYPWNQQPILSKHITRVRDWAEVEKILL